MPKAKKATSKKVGYGILAVIGFLLSPLSWWNDLLINIPLAYLFSIPFTLLEKKLFMPSFIVGYLLTNIIGFVLLHKGLKGLLSKDNRRSLWKDVLIALGYTALIVLLVVLKIIKPPMDYIH
jgi:hypothetical protein